LDEIACKYIFSWNNKNKRFKKKILIFSDVFQRYRIIFLRLESIT
jgi:hypothetical protein